jgi:hypothetical protein
MTVGSPVLHDIVGLQVLPVGSPVLYDLISLQASPKGSPTFYDVIGTQIGYPQVIPYVKDTTNGLGRPALETDNFIIASLERTTAGTGDLWGDANTTTITIGGGASQSTLTLGLSGVANQINGYTNIQGATSAVSDGDLAAGNGTNEFFFDASAGVLKASGANNEAWNIQHATIELTGLTGATATTSSLIPAGFIPAGSMVIGVTTRVNTLITGATSYDIGDGTDVDRWGATIAVALSTTSGPADYTDNTIQWQTAAAGDVVLTANGPNFSAGAVRITVAYISLTPPTS